MKAPHKRALLRNQVIMLIEYGHIVSTKARIKETQRLAEKIVTLARKGNVLLIASGLADGGYTDANKVAVAKNIASAI